MTGKDLAANSPSDSFKGHPVAFRPLCGCNKPSRYTSEELLPLFAAFARDGHMDFRCFARSAESGMSVCPQNRDSKPPKLVFFLRLPIRSLVHRRSTGLPAEPTLEVPKCQIRATGRAKCQAPGPNAQDDACDRDPED